MVSRTATATPSRLAWRSAACAAAQLAAALIPAATAATRAPQDTLAPTQQQQGGAGQMLTQSGGLRTLSHAPDGDYYDHDDDYSGPSRPTSRLTYRRAAPPPDYDYDYEYRRDYSASHDDREDYSFKFADYGLMSEEAQCTVVAAVEEVEVAGCGEIHASAGASAPCTCPLHMPCLPAAAPHPVHVSTMAAANGRSTWPQHMAAAHAAYEISALVLTTTDDCGVTL